jgi:hypothetical protein
MFHVKRAVQGFDMRGRNEEVLQCRRPRAGPRPRDAQASASSPQPPGRRSPDLSEGPGRSGGQARRLQARGQVPQSTLELPAGVSRTKQRAPGVLGGATSRGRRQPRLAAVSEAGRRKRDRPNWTGGVVRSPPNTLSGRECLAPGLGLGTSSAVARCFT